ncbi:nlpC/P60 family protein [Mycobacterium xenopi 4042]|uniref:NlpC/P60 family protein n=1 Tax=Mycobacterium xenopi 4042 TaxID=1299334 RepID=X7YQY7_MYCXE|nr:nlpC/P60 family protein [Mycobacterium xenopi 4042]
MAIANASIAATAQATQTTLDLGRKFLGSLGIGGAVPAGWRQQHQSEQNSAGVRSSGRRVRDPSGQLAAGVPYSWGGGTLQGPSRGVDSGADTVGFDCSGLTRYAFAGWAC